MSDADGGVRRLVLVHGRDQARTMVEPEQRPLVDIAAEVLSDDAGRIGISYSGFCMTGLPHKRLTDEQVWEKRGHRVTLLVEPGRMKHGTRPAQVVGVPYGARARMILLYLQTQAVRTGSREVELGRSLHNWLGRMGLSWEGETGRAARAGHQNCCLQPPVLLGRRNDGRLGQGWLRALGPALPWTRW